MPLVVSNPDPDTRTVSPLMLIPVTFDTLSRGDTVALGALAFAGDLLFVGLLDAGFLLAAMPALLDADADAEADADFDAAALAGVGAPAEAEAEGDSGSPAGTSAVALGEIVDVSTTESVALAEHPASSTGTANTAVVASQRRPGLRSSLQVTRTLLPFSISRDCLRQSGPPCELLRVALLRFALPNHIQLKMQAAPSRRTTC